MATATVGPDEGWEDVDWDFPTCPVNGCGRRVPRQRIFCSSHWRLVEHEIRRAIYDAARVLNDKAAPPENIVVAWSSWRTAVCRAIHCAEVHERG